MSYQLQEINRRIDQDVNGFLEECDAQYAEKVSQAADAILANLPLSPIVLLSGPSGSGKVYPPSVRHRPGDTGQRRDTL